MKTGLTLGLLLVFSHHSAQAELISLPDKCFEKKITPCLVRATSEQKLEDPELKMSYAFLAGTILKWRARGEALSMDILQGRVIIESLKVQNLSLNEIPIQSQQIFAERQEKKMKVYNVNNFILSQYEMNTTREQEMVLSRSDFPSKNDMVQFVSQFFENKKNLVTFLNRIKRPWQKEFKIQTDIQTKVLERSVASTEQAELDRRLARERQIEENKKVRDLFFYRTFYR